MSHGLYREHDPGPKGRGRVERNPDQVSFLSSTGGVRHDAVAEAARRRDVGTKRAMHGATAVARRAGEDAIRRLAARGTPFTADDVHDLLETERGPTLPSKLVGSLFREASQRGEIKSIGARRSERASRNRGLLMVWEGAD